MDKLIPFSTIDNTIRTDKYNSKKCGYNTCNLFLADTLKKHWNVDVPKMKDDQYQSIPTSSDGNKKDWPENPMSASVMTSYYKSRSEIKNSGVTEVSAEEGRKATNSGIPVVVLGSGHATIMAPSDESWPLIYRQDQAFSKDNRTRVGIKDKKAFKYYLLEPDKYESFNSTIKKLGFSEKDVFTQFNVDDELNYTGENQKYTDLRNTMDIIELLSKTK